MTLHKVKKDLFIATASFCVLFINIFLFLACSAGKLQFFNFVLGAFSSHCLYLRFSLGQYHKYRGLILTHPQQWPRNRAARWADGTKRLCALSSRVHNSLMVHKKDRHSKNMLKIWILLGRIFILSY